jgi:hypothetical protein
MKDQPTVTRDMVLRILGEWDEAKLTAILALKPTAAELQEAAIWLRGDANGIARDRVLSDKAAAIVWVLAPE